MPIKWMSKLKDPTMRALGKEHASHLGLADITTRELGRIAHMTAAGTGDQEIADTVRKARR